MAFEAIKEAQSDVPALLDTARRAVQVSQDIQLNPEEPERYMPEISPFPG